MYGVGEFPRRYVAPYSTLCGCEVLRGGSLLAEYVDSYPFHWLFPGLLLQTIEIGAELLQGFTFAEALAVLSWFPVKVLFAQLTSHFENARCAVLPKEMTLSRMSLDHLEATITRMLRLHTATR